MKDKNWEKKFDNRFVTDSFMGQIMGKPRYIGNETQEVKDIKSFIRTLLSKQRRQLIKEIKQGFVEIAIEGAKDPDKLRGLYLYSRFLTLLNDKMKEVKK